MSGDELLQKCRENAPGAFDALVKTYQHKIINIAYGMLCDREDAYDVAQEVFIKLYKNIGKFTGAAALDTWIYRITVNASLDELRKRGRRVHTLPLQVQTDEEEAYTLPIADVSKSPEHVALSNERRREILQAVSQLSEKYRSVLILREFEDLDYEQIAHALGISIGTVKSRLSRARENLRNLLEK